MPKFSAYMRGEEGPQGDVGQAVLLNGIVSSSSELPPNTQNQKNLVYYVGNNEDEYHLYVYTTTEGQWRDLGSIKGLKGDTGLAAGFATNQNYEIFAVDPDAEPQISIIPDPNSPNTAKVFNFTFGLPRGQNAGFNQNQNIEIENVNSVQEMYASVSTDENSPNTAKIFNFKFGIPRGEAADFGEPTASISTISSLSTASVSITSSGSATSKVFDFHFDIPQGQKGDRGDSFSIYEPVAFTTGSEYWIDNTTFIYPRGDNSKLPIYIYNEDTNSLEDSSFTYTTTDIIYNVEQPFNGTLYLMAGANRPTINIGEVSTTSFDGQMSASLNERSTSSDAIIDFTLAKGPDGEPGGFGEVTSTAELIPSASTYIEKDSIVSFSTDYDINDVIVDIEPVQDLHGYDHPWPAGGGKNLLPLTVDGIKSVNINGTWTGNVYARHGITYTLQTDGDNNVIGILVNGTNTYDGAIQFYLSNEESSWFMSLGEGTEYKIKSHGHSGNDINIRIGDKDNNYVTSTGSNDSGTFTADEKNTIRIHISASTTINNELYTPILMLSSETDDTFEPYSNICPISGWTGMNVQRTGKSLSNFEQGGMNKGINISSNTRIRTKNYIPYQQNKPIHINYNSNYSDEEIKIKIEYYDKNDYITERLSEYPSGNNWIVSSTTITNIPNNTKFIRLLAGLNSNTPITPDIGNNNINISYNTEIFEPYKGTTYPISWSTQVGTVYGGSLDVTTGMLMVDRAYIDMGTMTWGISAQGFGVSNSINTIIVSPPTSGTIIEGLSCSALKTTAAYNIYNGEYGIGVHITGDIRIRYEGMPETGEAIKAAVNGWQLVYPLATPITYQLTPTQITALLDQNNIWADTGDVQVSYNKFNQPYVEITTDEDSPNTAKRFNFHFGIPQGEKGAPGDAFAIYEPLSFTTGSSYWSGNTLVVPRGDNNKLPLFIYNRDNNNIAATFKLENNYIRHDADSPFNGTLYMMSQTNRSTLRIGNVSTTTYGNGSHFSLNEASTSTDAIFDVVLEQGPRGTTALSAQIGRVSYTSGIPNVEIEGEQDLVFNFDLPRGFKGEKGDTFTVDVDETIDVLGYNETPIVETTSTSTGIALKFKLPPSVSAQLGDLSQLNTISVTSNYITGILPVNKGGTGVGQLTTNAILLGNNTSIKQKATSAGAFYATGNNIEPGFGTLPIEYGGTGTTTSAGIAATHEHNYLLDKTNGNKTYVNYGAAGITSTSWFAAWSGYELRGISPTNAWTALGGGDSGKHPDNYFALANHGTHVSYGTSATAIATTAKAGTAGTLSRSDHVHNITLATGDSNGQVKIAGQNVAVKGLDSAAYTKSTAYAAANHTHSYLSINGGTLQGALNFKNNTWNNLGDDISFGDTNVSGCMSLKGLNATTGLNFIQYNGTAAGTIKWDGTTFTIPNTLMLTKTTDASGTVNNHPALIVGSATSAHIEIDTNEILAKSDGTTPSTLYLQDGNGTVGIYGSGGLIINGGNAITKVTFTNVDPGAGSNLANGNIVFVYE